MKKTIILVAALIAIAAFVAISNNGQKLAISANDGTSVSLSAKELLKIKDTDGRQWTNYYGATASGSGKITNIDSGHTTFYATLESVKGQDRFKYKYVTIEIDKQIVLLSRAEVSQDLYVGDTVSFEGTIEVGSSELWLHIDCADLDRNNPQPHIFLKN